MIDRNHPRISTARQCELLGLPRSTYYHEPKPMPAEELKLMRTIDEVYPRPPGVRLPADDALAAEAGTPDQPQARAALMRVMGLEAIYQKPNLSRSHPQHRVYPHLLRNLEVVRPNQVWAMDITYIPIEGGCLYLCAVLEWYSRAVLAWELSNTLDARFCVEAVRQAIARYGIPEIFNTDQGCQFTSAEFTQPLLALGVKLSMDGKGRALDTCSSNGCGGL